MLSFNATLQTPPPLRVRQESLPRPRIAVTRKQLHALFNNVKVLRVLKAKRINRPPALPPSFTQICAHFVLNGGVNVAAQSVGYVYTRELKETGPHPSNDRVPPVQRRLRRCLTGRVENKGNGLRYTAHDLLKELPGKLR